MHLRDFRLKLGLSQAAMAQRLGIPSQGSYCEIENGDAWPNPVTLERIYEGTIDQRTGRQQVTANDIFDRYRERQKIKNSSRSAA